MSQRSWALGAHDASHSGDGRAHGIFMGFSSHETAILPQMVQEARKLDRK